MRHPERIPFRAVTALDLPWAPSIDATHLLMAPMALFQAKTLRMRIAATSQYHCPVCFLAIWFLFVIPERISCLPEYQPELITLEKVM